MRMLLLFLVTICCAMAGNIVTNGGFETGDLTGWTTNRNALDPWIIGPPGYSSQGGPSSAHSGLYFVTEGCDVLGGPCVGAGATEDYLYQDLTTVPGGIYTLSFYYDQGRECGGGTCELEVLFGGVSVLDLKLSSGRNTDPGYSFYSVTGLTATSTTTRLQFDGNQDYSFDALDDVSVSQIPEPTSLILGGIGLLTLGLCRSRIGSRSVPCDGDAGSRSETPLALR